MSKPKGFQPGDYDNVIEIQGQFWHLKYRYPPPGVGNGEYSDKNVEIGVRICTGEMLMSDSTVPASEKTLGIHTDKILIKV